MSRCFPFPPPGYEKKVSTGQSDILKKEKHREKKRKKEKKDKDKKEDKEKKDRDKKDKKEKGRDKKKEKERDKDQHLDNLNTIAETRPRVPSQGHNGQNVIQKDSDLCTMPNDHLVPGRNAGYNEGYHDHYASLAEEPIGAKFVLSAERSVGDVTERGGGNMMHEKIFPTPHKRNEGVGKLSHSSQLSNNFKNSNLALELDRRLKNEAEQSYDQSQTSNKPIGGNQKRDGRVVKSVPSHTMEKGNTKTMDLNGWYVGDKSGKVNLVPHTSGLGQGNHDRMARPSPDSQIVNKIEDQERINHRENEFLQQGKKRKDKERNGDRKSHEKHKSREKDKMEDKSNCRSDQNNAGQGTRESRKMDILIPPNKEMLQNGEPNLKNTSNDLKRNQTKGFLTNGVVAHVTGPSVLSRPSSLHDENGRAPELHQILAKPSTGGPGSSKMDKAGKINGILRPATEQVVQTRPRSPHPDAKRLPDILAIPKIEELSEIDDSDWLISSEEKPGKKHKRDDSRVTIIAETPQVWSKATIIDSADVCALPYVIPY